MHKSVMDLREQLMFVEWDKMIELEKLQTEVKAFQEQPGRM